MAKSPARPALPAIEPHLRVGPPSGAAGLAVLPATADLFGPGVSATGTALAAGPAMPAAGVPRGFAMPIVAVSGPRVIGGEVRRPGHPGRVGPVRA